MASDAELLVPFSPERAAQIVSWPRSADEADAWCSIRDDSIAPEVVTAWAEAPNVEAYVYEIEGEAVGYGELWIDHDESEVELGHLIVDPNRRNEAVGRRMVRALCRRGWEHFDSVVLRVRSENAAAQKCYLAAGFTRASTADEASWNDGQPHAYAWMLAERQQ